MLFSFAYFTIALTLGSSALGAAIPPASLTSSPGPIRRYPEAAPTNVNGALWKNNVHDRVYSPGDAPAVTLLPQRKAAPIRRNGELWMGREHEEVEAPSRRSGELWMGREHEEVGVPSRRSGELWMGREHEEVARADPVLLDRSGELWRGLEHQEVSGSDV